MSRPKKHTEEAPELRAPVGAMDKNDRALLIRAHDFREKIAKPCRTSLERLSCSSKELSTIEIEIQRMKNMLDDADGGADREGWTFDEDRRSICVTALRLYIPHLDKIASLQLKETITPNDTNLAIGHAKALCATINGAPIDFGDAKDQIDAEFGELEVPEGAPKAEGDDLPDGPSHRMGSVRAPGDAEKPENMSDEEWEQSGRRRVPVGGEKKGGLAVVRDS